MPFEYAERPADGLAERQSQKIPSSSTKAPVAAITSAVHLSRTVIQSSDVNSIAMMVGSLMGINYLSRTVFVRAIVLFYKSSASDMHS